MILPLFLTLLFQLAGEALARLSPVPLPGPVIGMVLMVAALAASPALMRRLRGLAQTMLAHLSLLFVPAGVGIMGHAGLLREQGAAVLAAVAVSTVLAMAVAALTFRAVARLTGGPARDA